MFEDGLVSVGIGFIPINSGKYGSVSCGKQKTQMRPYVATDSDFLVNFGHTITLRYFNVNTVIMTCKLVINQKEALPASSVDTL